MYNLAKSFLPVSFPIYTELFFLEVRNLLCDGALDFQTSKQNHVKKK